MGYSTWLKIRKYHLLSHQAGLKLFSCCRGLNGLHVKFLKLLCVLPIFITEMWKLKTFVTLLLFLCLQHICQSDDKLLSLTQLEQICGDPKFIGKSILHSNMAIYYIIITKSGSEKAQFECHMAVAP